MIAASQVTDYIKSFKEEVVSTGVKRKVVRTLNYGKIYLHPSDPRFGCDEERVLYSFRRPMGYNSKGNRTAGVDYGKPKELKGHSDKKGVYWISIETYKKVKKESFINEILPPEQPK